MTDYYLIRHCSSCVPLMHSTATARFRNLHISIDRNYTISIIIVIIQVSVQLTATLQTTYYKFKEQDCMKFYVNVL